MRARAGACPILEVARARGGARTARFAHCEFEKPSRALRSRQYAHRFVSMSVLLVSIAARSAAAGGARARAGSNGRASALSRERGGAAAASKVGRAGAAASASGRESGGAAAAAMIGGGRGGGRCVA